MHKIKTLFLSWDIEKSSLIALRCAAMREVAASRATVPISWYVKDYVRAGGLFWRTDSEYIIWHNAGTTHVTENTREGRNVSVFGKSLDVYGCTPTHEVLQHEASQIRQERFFSKHVRGLMMITPFENETRSVSSCAPSSRWRNFECTLQLIKTTSTEETSHASEPLQVVPADRRWSIGPGPLAGDGQVFQANRNWNFMPLPFLFECKVDFRKLFIGSTAWEWRHDLAVSRKRPKTFSGSLFILFYYYYFFFYYFAPFLG